MKCNAAKKYSYEKILEKIVCELLFLEKEGIWLDINGNSINVHFALALVIGDNLGVHFLLGQVEAFAAHRPCRFCTASLQSIRECTVLKNIEMRDTASHESQIAKYDPSSTGIVRRCAFNQLLSFHAFQNQAVDIMHDMSLGFLRYDMALIIQHIMSLKKITLCEMNAKIQNFDFGADKSDKPAIITDKHIKQGSVILYAAEMANLVKYFTFIFGNLDLEDTPIWNFALAIREMTEILHCSSLQLGMVTILKDVIEKYFTLRKVLFPKDQLKPKHHFLLHYVDLIPRIGPLINVWCMPYEAKHQQLLAYAKNNKNFQNLPLSIAKKHQNNLSYYIQSNAVMKPEICLGPKKASKISELEDFHNFALILSGNPSQVSKWITVNNVKYSVGQFIVGESRDGLIPTFCEIKYILYDTENCESSFLLKAWNTITLSEYLHAYEIEEGSEWQHMSTDRIPDYGSIQRLVFSGNQKVYVMYFD